MVRWIRWHCPPDTGFWVRALAVWARARYFSVTEAPHNIEFLWVSGEETFCFLETWRSKWGSNPRSPTFQAGSFNNCTRAPTLLCWSQHPFWFSQEQRMYIFHSVHERTEVASKLVIMRRRGYLELNFRQELFRGVYQLWRSAHGVVLRRVND